MHKVAVIMNSRASHSEVTSQEVQWLKEILFRSSIIFYSPETLESLAECLDNIVREKFDVVVPVGGDGTFNLVVQKIAHTGIKTLPIPTGTANDLANELGIVGKLKKAFHKIREDDFLDIDLIEINGRYMVTNGGIGLAGMVAEKINDYRAQFPLFKKVMKSFDHHVYGLGMVGALSLPKMPRVDLRFFSDSVERVVNTPLFLVNNQPNIARSFKIAPRTKNNDGLFNVSIFEHPKRIQLLKTIWQVRSGVNVESDSNFFSMEVSNCKVEVLGETPLSFFGDGEILAQGTSFDIKIHPKALSVISSEEKLGVFR
ncbi:hypothetical protein GW915_03370 [bacterium]|nr:hypothetical protein [bacterium]